MRGPRTSAIAWLVMVTATFPFTGGRAAAQGSPDRAVSYINRDTGTAAENRNVDEGSSCEQPDRHDVQQLSDRGAPPGNRNVHNDACLFEGDAPFDGPATFESKGVGEISACPDPDLIIGSIDGPKTAVAHDHDRDGRVDHCHQSGSQLKLAAGDGEYHARLNNSSRAGTQSVKFCYDPDRDGCSDESVRRAVVIEWVRAPKRALSYINRDTGTPTENPNVDPGSSCRTPDRYDVQPLSDEGTTNRNVHNDACLRAAGIDFDGTVTFRSKGAGWIVACPDPDATATGNGPKTAETADRDGDGRLDMCRQSGYQQTGSPGDGEYHVRLNNDEDPGLQVVTFCYDPDRDGCADESLQSTVRVNWVSG